MASQLARKKACVVGGSGYLASSLVKLLLENGYAVNATVRDPGNQKKISHLIDLQKLGDLNIFGADLTNEDSFDAPIEGCKFVFHVATPIDFASKDPENDMIKPAIQGVMNVLKACARAKSVKRFVYTSSAGAVVINTMQGPGLEMTEDNWSDVEFLSNAKPPTWGYAVSKTLAEKKAFEFAKQNNIDMVSVIPSIMTGRSLTRDTPHSVSLATSLLTGNEFLINAMKGMQMLCGSISILHVEDVCRAHIFVAEKDSASGRFICSVVNSSVPELAKFLNKRYPHYKVPTDFGDFPSKPKLTLSSKKLIKEGFNFKYGIEEIYDKSIEYLKDVGVLIE